MTEKTLYDYEKNNVKDANDSLNGREWKDDFCALCGSKTSHQCVKCEKRICSKHFVSLMGLCVECAPVRKPKEEEKDEVVVVKGKKKTMVTRKEDTSKEDQKNKENAEKSKKKKMKESEKVKDIKIEWV